MPFNEIPILSDSSNMDFDVLNDLIENDKYLKSITPDVLVYFDKTYTANSETGAQMKIQGGSFLVPGFTGKKTINVSFLAAHTGAFLPPVLLTPYSSTPMYAQVVAMNAKGFTLMLQPYTKAKTGGVRVSWMALTQSGG